MRIPGCVGLVTGGASGLGAACAEMLVSAGGSVTILDLDESRGRQLAATLGDRSIFVRADVSSLDADRAVGLALRRWGRLDVAINCAGIAPPKRILSKDGPMPLEDFRKTIEINLIGTFNICRLAAAAIWKNEPEESGERGVIINTASIAAFDGQIGQCAYAASKAGIAGMTLPMARDLARHGIRVMTIAPGIFDTPLLASLPEDARTNLAAAVPFPQKLGDAKQFAQLARAIIENSYLNGETIRLDAALRMGPK
jgi:NAD(P)-dependent dehydrogenase (short-subunit alcohol dehydrogenase family)